MNHAQKIVICGAISNTPGGAIPVNVTTTVLACSDGGILYTELVVGSSGGPTVLEMNPWNTFGGVPEGLPTLSYPYVWNGADSAYTQKAVASANLNPAPGSGPQGALMTGNLPEWSLTHAPNVATRATISRAALALNRHVCRGISATFCVAPADTATTALLHLRDGATGAGTILRTWRLAGFNTTQGDKFQVDIAGLNIVGGINTAMTLEFAAAPGAASFQSVGISGITVGV
jgi:hypothetical protein